MSRERQDVQVRTSRKRTGSGSRVDLLLPRLAQVRKTGKGKWMARCPSHPDSTPSLSIRETDDRVLIHCHAGCGPADIVDAVGLSLGDLFISGGVAHHVPSRRSRHLPASELLKAVRHALAVLRITDSDLRRGKPLSEKDRKAVDRALAVLNQARRDTA